MFSSLLAEYTDGDDLPQDETRRVWESDDPFVALVEDGLARRDREMLDRSEASATDKELEDAADDLRLLLEAHVRSAELELELDLFGPVVSFDPTFANDVPTGKERFLLSVDVPVLDGRWRRGWGISLHRWVDDEFDEEGLATGPRSEEVLYCALEERPDLSDVIELLDQARDRLSDWACTPVGEALEGTVFVVTRRSQS